MADSVPKPTLDTPPPPTENDEFAGYDLSELEDTYRRAASATLRAMPSVQDPANPWRPIPVTRSSWEEAKTKGLKFVLEIIREGRVWDPTISTPTQLKLTAQLGTEAKEAEARAIKAEKRADAFLAYTLSETGASLVEDPETGEFTVQVDKTHPFQVSARLKAEKEQAALEGKLPVPGALEEDIRKAEEGFEARMLSQLGPGYQTSTPYLQGKAELTKQANLARDAARRGDIQQFAGLSAAARQEAGGVQPNLAYANLYQVPTNIRQGLLGTEIGQQQFGMQLALQREAIEAERERAKAMERAALYGAVGSVAGLGGGYLAASKFGGGK